MDTATRDAAARQLGGIAGVISGLAGRVPKLISGPGAAACLAGRTRASRPLRSVSVPACPLSLSLLPTAPAGNRRATATGPGPQPPAPVCLSH